MKKLTVNKDKIIDGLTAKNLELVIENEKLVEQVKKLKEGVKCAVNKQK